MAAAWLSHVGIRAALNWNEPQCPSHKYRHRAPPQDLIGACLKGPEGLMPFPQDGQRRRLRKVVAFFRGSSWAGGAGIHTHRSHSNMKSRLKLNKCVQTCSPFYWLTRFVITNCIHPIGVWVFNVSWGSNCIYSTLDLFFTLSLYSQIAKMWMSVLK